MCGGEIRTKVKDRDVRRRVRVYSVLCSAPHKGCPGGRYGAGMEGFPTTRGCHGNALGYAAAHDNGKGKQETRAP